MDKHINKWIEKAVNKGITGFQRELIKVALLYTIGLLISIYHLITDIHFTLDGAFFVYSIYPVGFYYGWRTVFKLLKGQTSSALDTAFTTTFFSGGNGIMGMIFGMFQFMFMFFLAITVGWIVGFVNLVRTLMHYKSQEKMEMETMTQNEDVV